MKRMELITAKLAVQPHITRIRSLLEQMENFLTKPTDNHLFNLVRFLDLVAKLQDEAYFARLLKLSKRRKGLRTLRLSLYMLDDRVNAFGRSENGMNRTRKGEPVTSRNVWIGAKSIHSQERTVLSWYLDRYEDTWEDVNENARHFLHREAGLLAAVLEDLLEVYEETFVRGGGEDDEIIPSPGIQENMDALDRLTKMPQYSQN